MEPLYPAFLATARVLAGDVFSLVMLIQAIVAAAGAVLLHQLTRSVTGSGHAALLAAALYALDPYFVRQSVSLIELPLLLTLLVWALRAFFAIQTIRQAVLTGVLLGALFLTRASLLPVGIGAVILGAQRRGWRFGVAMGAAAILVVLPWSLRSFALDGSLLPSRAGENLFVSTSPYAIGVLPQHDVDLLVPFAHELIDRELSHASPAQFGAAADDLLRSRAWQFARSHPRETLILKLRNLVYIFRPGLLPVETKSGDTHAVLDGSRVRIINAQPRPWPWEWIHTSVRTFVLVSALFGLAARRRHWRDDALLHVLALSVIAVHVVFFPTTRLLAPLTIVLMIYAGSGLSVIWQRFTL